MTRCRALGFLLCASVPLWFISSRAQADDKKPAAIPETVSYYKDVRPIFVLHCQGCHQPAKPMGGFVMTSHADMLKPGDSGEPGVVAGQPDKSKLISQITPDGMGKAAMPKSKDPLIDRDREIIKKWIAQGAKDDTPKSAKHVVDAEHPPVYPQQPIVSALDYSPDGKLLAVTGYHEVLLHNADGSGLVGRLVGLSERVQSLAFSPDGKLLAVAGGSPGRFGEIQVWDVDKKKLKLSQTVTFDTLYGVSWSPDASKIAFGCADNTVRAIDASNGKQVLFQGAHNDWVMGTAFSQTGEYLISVSRDRSAKMTEVATQRFMDNITSITPGALKGGLLAVSRRPRNEKEKRMSKVPPDTPGAKPLPYDEVLLGGSDGQPKLYKIHREAKRVIGDDFNKVRLYEPMSGRIYAACFNKDGALFAAGSSFDGKGEARVYKVDADAPVAKCDGVKSPVYAIAFAPDSKTIALGGFDGMVRLHDAATGKLVKEFAPAPVATASVQANK